jgi:hypothetical protein
LPFRRSIGCFAAGSCAVPFKYESTDDSAICSAENGVNSFDVSGKKVKFSPSHKTEPCFLVPEPD